MSLLFQVLTQLLFFSSLSAVFGINVCPNVVCEFGKACKIRHEWPAVRSEDLTFTWFRHGKPVSSCTTRGKCQPYPDFKDTVVPHSEINNNKFVNTLDLSSNTTASGQWDLNVDEHTSFTCNVTVYTKIDDVMCELVESDGVWLQCQISNVFPAKCKMLGTSNEGGSQNFRYSFEKDIRGFSTSCSIVLKVKNHTENVFKFTLKVYPNITNSENDIDYGTEFNRSFCIGPPLIKHTCPDEVFEGKRLNCTCEKADSCNDKVTISLYKKGMLITESVNSVYINTQIEHSIVAEITCFGTNLLEWRSNNVTYCPKFREKVDSSYKCAQENLKPCNDYGDCYNNTQYCSEKKQVESCFPTHIKAYELREWCQEFGQYNVSLMRHPSCNIACDTAFNITDPPSGQSKKESYSEEVVLLIVLSVGITIILVLLSLFMLYCYRRKKKRPIETQPRERHTSDDAETSFIDDQNIDEPTNNSEDS